jgi:hypothetical protein
VWENKTKVLLPSMLASLILRLGCILCLPPCKKESKQTSLHHYLFTRCFGPQAWHLHSSPDKSLHFFAQMQGQQLYCGSHCNPTH